MQYRGSLASWRLQYLTDLSVLPDPEPGYGHYWGGNPQGAGFTVEAAAEAAVEAIPSSAAAAELGSGVVNLAAVW